MITSTHSFFVPIYNYGDPARDGAGTVFGTTLYLDLQELFAYEPDAVGFFEVEGTITLPRLSGAV